MASNGAAGDMREVMATAQKAVLHTYKTDEGREFIVLPADMEHHELKRITPALPARVMQAVRLTAKDSFIDYVSAFKSTASRVFADLERASFVAALDYHASNESVGAVAHRATLNLVESEEWQRWSRISGKLMAQIEFVRFLEENAADIVVPDGADILELAKDMSASKKVDFRQAVRMQTGDTSFEYVVDAEAKSKSGHIEVPNKFVLKIPVFYGEAPMEVHAFLRWSIDEGSLKLGVELHRPRYIRQALFEAIGRDIQERTQTPLHYGALG